MMNKKLILLATALIVTPALQSMQDAHIIEQNLASLHSSLQLLNQSMPQATAPVATSAPKVASAETETNSAEEKLKAEIAQQTEKALAIINKAVPADERQAIFYNYDPDLKALHNEENTGTLDPLMQWYWEAVIKNDEPSRNILYETLKEIFIAISSSPFGAKYLTRTRMWLDEWGFSDHQTRYEGLKGLEKQLDIARDTRMSIEDLLEDKKPMSPTQKALLEKSVNFLAELVKSNYLKDPNFNSISSELMKEEKVGRALLAKL